MFFNHKNNFSVESCSAIFHLFVSPLRGSAASAISTVGLHPRLCYIRPSALSDARGAPLRNLRRKHFAVLKIAFREHKYQYIVNYK